MRLGSQIIGRSKKLWSGRKREERREVRVDFAIKTKLVGKLSGLPKGINERLMALRLPLSGNKHATIANAYAPTMTNPNEVKDKFYNDLDDVISVTPRTDMRILLGGWYRPPDLGRSYRSRRGCNGLLLLRNCAERQHSRPYTY